MDYHCTRIYRISEHNNHYNTKNKYYKSQGTQHKVHQVLKFKALV